MAYFWRKEHCSCGLKRGGAWAWLLLIQNKWRKKTEEELANLGSPGKRLLKCRRENGRLSDSECNECDTTS